MGVLDNLDLNNVPELCAASEGEYELRILEAGEHTSKTSGKLSVKVVLEIVSEANADYIYHYLGTPQPDDDERTQNNKLRRIKAFLDAFGIEQGLPYDDWRGLVGWALVGVEVDNQTGEPRNVVKRFVTGQ